MVGEVANDLRGIIRNDRYPWIMHFFKLVDWPAARANHFCSWICGLWVAVSL
jgi:hypothetical protein